MRSKIAEDQAKRLSEAPAGLGITSDSDSSAESAAPIATNLRERFSFRNKSQQEIENLIYSEFAWEFLRLNKSFVNFSDDALHGTRNKSDVAAQFYLKEFKHHSESFHDGTAPRFISSSISYWSNIDATVHGNKRSIPRRLREGEVFILFNLKEAMDIADESIDVQLKRAKERLNRLLARYRTMKKTEERPRLKNSKLYNKSELMQYYNLYVSTEYEQEINIPVAYAKHFPITVEKYKNYPNRSEVLEKKYTLAMKNARRLVFTDYRKLAIFDHRKN